MKYVLMALLLISCKSNSVTIISDLDKEGIIGKVKKREILSYRKIIYNNKHIRTENFLNGRPNGLYEHQYFFEGAKNRKKRVAWLKGDKERRQDVEEQILTFY